jgi:hypothetical protein
MNFNNIIYDKETIKKLGQEFFELYMNCKAQVEKIEKILEQLEIHTV